MNNLIRKFESITRMLITACIDVTQEKRTRTSNDMNTYTGRLKRFDERILRK